mgnify:CR=1 FL=1
MSSKSTMKALVVDVPQGAFRQTEIARPEAATGEVLVRIQASGVNPLDTKIRAGNAAHAGHPFPAVLGIDLAGVVEQVGPGVTEFHRGDEVLGGGTIRHVEREAELSGRTGEVAE